MVLTSLHVEAQQEKRTIATPEERAQKMTERMTEELALSEGQKASILAINLENATMRQAQKEKETAERKTRMDGMKAQEEKIKAVLTEEQRIKWEEIKLEQRDRRRPGGEVHDRRSINHRGSRSN